MASLDALGTIYLPSSTAVGGEVPLSALVKVSERTAPLSIGHLGQFPATTVSFNLAPGAALGSAVDAITQAEKDIHLPPSLMTTFQGAALAFQATLGNELFLILAALVTVYIVLGRPLRELHPPHHDPLDPALGRCRRAARAPDRRR